MCTPSEYGQQDLRSPQGCVRGFRTYGKWHCGTRWMAPCVLKTCSTFLFKGHIAPAVLGLYDAWYNARAPEDLNPTVHILSAVKLWGSSSYTVVCATAVFYWYKGTGRWQIICTVKYTDDLLLLAKEETVLQGMIDGVTEISICYGTEMNVIKTKIMRISRQPSTIQITINHKQQENVWCISTIWLAW